MDSILREILEKHEYRHSTDYEMSYCSCGVDTPGRKAWLDHIESLESQQAKTRGKGMENFPVPDDVEQTILPPQRSMTPEESANLAAYHKTIFKRVVAQGDELREAASKLVAKLDLIHADERYKGIFSLAVLHGFQYTGPNYETELANLRAALSHEKAAPEEVTQASNELGTCDILSEPHETGFTYSPTHLHLCSNWRPLPKGDAK